MSDLLDIIADKTAGIIIGAGLTITGSWWAINTFLREDLGEEGKKQAKIAFYVMCFFMFLFTVKILLGPRIGKLAQKTLGKQIDRARVAVDRLSKIKNNPISKQTMDRRKLISSKPVAGVGLALAIYLAADMYNAEKSGSPRALQGTKAMIFTGTIIFLSFGQLIKDSSSGALAKAVQVAGSSTGAAAAPVK
jgi:hypothetical protein